MRPLVKIPIVPDPCLDWCRPKIWSSASPNSIPVWINCVKDSGMGKVAVLLNPKIGFLSPMYVVVSEAAKRSTKKPVLVVEGKRRGHFAENQRHL